MTMSEMTLVLTRTPLQEFMYISSARQDTNEDVTGSTNEERGSFYQEELGKDPKAIHLSGLWGSLGVIRGPKVTSARLSNPPNGDSGGLILAGRTLELQTDGQPVEAYTEYTTMERYRSDNGRVGGDDGYVMLHPQPSNPYRLRTWPGNEVVMTLRPGHSGNCLRILDTNPGKEAAILFHEAPHAGWLLGCISPRPKGNKGVFDNRDGNPSYVAFNEIYDQMDRVANGKGLLFVLDWG
jgi:hypothetical protein